MDGKPQYYSETKDIGHLEMSFKGEAYDGGPILDTVVTIGSSVLCHIT